MMKLAFSGAAGSVVRHLALKEDRKDAFTNITVGTLMSVFIGPATVPFWTVNGLLSGFLNETQSIMLAGFCTGVASMVITGLIIDFVRARNKMSKGNDDD